MNNISNQAADYLQFGTHSRWEMVTIEVHMRVQKSAKRSLYAMREMEILTSHYLDQLLSTPSTVCEPRIESRRHWFSVWHYVVRREFRLGSLKDQKGTHDVKAFLRTELAGHGGIVYDLSHFIYTDPADTEI